MQKLMGILFGIASLAMLCMVLWYIIGLRSPAGDWTVKVEHLQENWNLVAIHWRIEFIAALLMTWVAFHFSGKTSWWYLVAIGHILMMGEYTFMLAGYPYVETREGFNLMNQMATWAFASSNFVWLVGIAGVYFQEKGWLKYTGTALALIAAAFFLIFMLGYIGMAQASIGGPVVMLLYLLNAYFGFVKLPAD